MALVLVFVKEFDPAWSCGATGDLLRAGLGKHDPCVPCCVGTRVGHHTHSRSGLDRPSSWWRFSGALWLGYGHVVDR